MQAVATLTISDLWIERDERDLCAGLSVQLVAGEAIRILGVNGAGKSSLLKVIAGVMSPLKGEIHYLGHDVTHDRRPPQPAMLYLGHSLGIKNLLTVSEHIRLYCPSVLPETLQTVLTQLGLIDYADTQVKALSAGQKQRVALSRLWVENKVLWLLDEPFATLDVNAVALLELRIKQHVSAGGLVLFTTHQEVLSLNAREVSWLV